MQQSSVFKTNLDQLLENSPFALKFDDSVNSNGYCKYFQGETCVVASVYGPNSRSSHRKDFEKGVIEVTFKRDDEKEQQYLEQKIKRIFDDIVALERYPRCVISIIVSVVEDGGCILSAAINAVTNSLLSNGIALNATVLAVEAKIFKDTEGKRVLNFYKAAEKSKELTEEGRFLIGYELSSAKISFLDMDVFFTRSELDELLKIGLQFLPSYKYSLKLNVAKQLL